MGSLPPLGGAWEPIRRVTANSESVMAGDVFWELSSDTPNERVGSAMHAMMRSALGIVTTDSRVEPWAGAFRLHVADAARAFVDMARWVRQQCHGPVIELIGGRQAELAAGLIGVILEVSRGEQTRMISGATEVDRVLSLLEGDEYAASTIINRSPIVNSDSIENSTLCCPEIVAITCSRIGRSSEMTSQEKVASHIGSWLSKRADHGVLVLNADDPRLCWATINCPESIRWIGSNSHLDLTVRYVGTRDGVRRFLMDGRTIRVSRQNGSTTNSVMVALAVAQSLGIESADAAMAISQYGIADSKSVATAV